MSEPTASPATYDYLVLKVDGTKQCFRLDAPMRLADLQVHVEGYIEFTPLAPRRDHEQRFEMCVNEEGRLLDLPVNIRASEIAGTLIVGNAVLALRSTFRAADNEEAE